jgi:uncharacterized protein
MPLQLGHFQPLTLDRITPPGAFLTDGDQEVLLPTKYIPANTRPGDTVNAFIYRDSEDRLIATTLTPYLKRGEFGYLKVRQVTPVGAFLEWGIEKDLLVPFREQAGRMEAGKWYLVHLYLDTDTDRLAASQKVSRFVEKKDIALTEGEEVDLLICHETELGVQVIINQKYMGLVFRNELFKDLMEGDHTTGYIKAIRDDKKIDVTLRKPGLEGLEQGAAHILASLKAHNGYLPLHDKSDPADIQLELQMSKKNFKRSVGILFKQRLVRIEVDGVYLV